MSDVTDSTTDITPMEAAQRLVDNVLAAFERALQNPREVAEVQVILLFSMVQTFLPMVLGETKTIDELRSIELLFMGRDGMLARIRKRIGQYEKDTRNGLVTAGLPEIPDPAVLTGVEHSVQRRELDPDVLATLIRNIDKMLQAGRGESREES